MRDPASEQRFREFLAAKAARWGSSHCGADLVPAGRLPAYWLGKDHYPGCCLPALHEPLASLHCLGSLGAEFGLTVTVVLPDGLTAVTMPSITLVKLAAIPYAKDTNMHGRECSSAAAPCHHHAAHLGWRT